jgi:hypothetical protein
VNTAASQSAASDFVGVRLPDLRLAKRLVKVVASLEEQPDASFPKVFESDSDLEAFYRFVGNDRVDWNAVFDGHVESTVSRAKSRKRVLALHDSSLFQFGGVEVREGCFRTAKDKSGFLGHTCLAVSADGLRQPLGLLGMLPVVRLEGEDAHKSPGLTYGVESERWLDLVSEVERRSSDELELIHVMDSEGDSYWLLDFMRRRESEFIVRMCQDRLITGEDDTQRLSAALEQSPLRFTRTVKLTRRKGEARTGRHAARDERQAKLAVRVSSVEFRRPAGLPAASEKLGVNIVDVVEIDVPEGMVPVSWRLATTLPVQSDDDVAAVIDGYRARWQIEEWFKALKTGCSYQSRQLDNLDALLVTFAMLAPIATQLLALRWIGRNEGERDAAEVLSDDQLTVLAITEKQRGRTLPDRPTVAEAMLAVARLGGFITSNKVPGWQVMGRGMEDLHKMVRLFRGLKSEAIEM